MNMATSTHARLSLVVGFLVTLLLIVSKAALGVRSVGSQLSDAQQCRIQRLSTTQPSRRIESEGGYFEMWDENEEQFQCAGVAATRAVIRPNSIHLPSFHPSPRLVYILQGRGLLGITIPGCAETFTSQRPQQQQQQEQQQLQFQQGEDQHQRVHHIRKGDVIAVPAGAAHWCANHDEQEDLVAITINDLNHLSNQLDQRLRVFYLGGGTSREQQQQQGQEYQQQNFQNIFSGFDPELLSEAFNIPIDTARKMQRPNTERGFIVKSRGLRSILTPWQEQQQGQEQEQEQEQQQGQPGNGLEETFCSMRIHHNIDHPSQADVYSRQAGRITMADRFKLPILKFLDMSIERGDLFPQALLSPHWTMNGHCIMYVIRGDARLEAVNHRGENLMNDRVKEGDMVVVPQFIAATLRAGNNGIDYVAIKTTASPMTSPVAGYTSVLRALPLEVVRQSYQISPGEAQQLKLNRGTESILLSPSQQQQQSGQQRPYK